MDSTALPLLFPEMLDEQSAFLRADGSLLSLYEAFAAVPDPRSRHGQRYDLPSLLTCLVAALRGPCNSLEAVGQWCRDHLLLLRRLFGPRDFSTPTGSLSRRLLPRLSVGHIEVVLAAWVQASPRRLLDLARGHWSIENRLHSVRYVSFGEDRSRLRSGSAPADHGRTAQFGHHPYSSQWLLSDCGFSTPLRRSSSAGFLSPSSKKEARPAIIHRP